MVRRQTANLLFVGSIPTGASLRQTYAMVLAGGGGNPDAAAQWDDGSLMLTTDAVAPWPNAVSVTSLPRDSRASLHRAAGAQAGGARPHVVERPALRRCARAGDHKWATDVTPDHNVNLPFIRMVAGPMGWVR